MSHERLPPDVHPDWPIYCSECGRRLVTVTKRYRYNGHYEDVHLKCPKSGSFRSFLTGKDHYSKLVIDGRYVPPVRKFDSRTGERLKR